MKAATRRSGHSCSGVPTVPPHYSVEACSGAYKGTPPHYSLAHAHYIRGLTLYCVSPRMNR